MPVGRQSPQHMLIRHDWSLEVNESWTQQALWLWDSDNVPEEASGAVPIVLYGMGWPSGRADEVTKPAPYCITPKGLAR